MKQCSKCKTIKPLDNFYLKSGRINQYLSYCKECFNRQCHKYQIDKKMEIVRYKGGKCCCCDYDRNIDALEFHHVEPNKKDFNISKIRNRKLESIKHEVDKCILVCANCHKEIHSGIILLVITQI